MTARGLMRAITITQSNRDAFTSKTENVSQTHDDNSSDQLFLSGGFFSPPPSSRADSPMQLQKYLKLDQKGKIMAEYVWIDAAGEVRSKSRVSFYVPLNPPDPRTPWDMARPSCPIQHTPLGGLATLSLSLCLPHHLICGRPCRSDMIRQTEWRPRIWKRNGATAGIQAVWVWCSIVGRWVSNLAASRMHCNGRPCNAFWGASLTPPLAIAASDVAGPPGADSRLRFAAFSAPAACPGSGCGVVWANHGRAIGVAPHRPPAPPPTTTLAARGKK